LKITTALRAAITPGAPVVKADVHGPAYAVAVSVWNRGRTMARVDGYGTDVGAATDAAAETLRVHPAIKQLTPQLRDEVRIQVDVISGTGPLGGGYWLFDRFSVPGLGDMLAVNPGVEGVGADLGKNGKPTLLLPHELVASKLLTAKRPWNELPEFAMGMDMVRIRALLATRAGKTSKPPSPDGKLEWDFPLFRFRTDTFVEKRDHAQTVALYRGIPKAPPIDGKVLRKAALAGGDYLIAHLGKNGRYIYEHDLASGTQTDPNRLNGAYSMPRHAGTTYFLAELYRITKEQRLREPIERAFAHLAELLAGKRCERKLPDGQIMDCVLDKNETVSGLGSTALMVVALAEYQRATGDTRYLEMTTKFATYLMWMQRDDGSFRHLYTPSKGEADQKTELLYYSGEAALALARMYEITKDPKYALASQKALDWLVGWYDFFMGGFFYGEEHWTCIAAEALDQAYSRDSYMDFCHGYGAFLRGQQPAVGEHPDEDDLAGAYGVTPFIPPYNTPAGSRTEAMISAYVLGKKRGAPDDDVRQQIHDALSYVIGQQITEDSDFNVVGQGLGGMPGTPIDRTVRIDFVQHVCSAMIRASEWIDE